MRTALLALVGAAGLAASANADVLAHWTFETTGAGFAAASNQADLGPLAAEAGVFAASSFASAHHARAATDYSSPSGNGSAESMSSNEWTQGDYYEFESSTVGYGSLLLSWSQARSSTGPAPWRIHGTLDGINYIDLGATYTVLENSAVNGGAWNGTTHVVNYDFGPFIIGGADNSPILGFRLVCDVTPTNAGGTCRVDDFKLEGTLLPAPGAFALLGLGGLVAGRRRR